MNRIQCLVKPIALSFLLMMSFVSCNDSQSSEAKQNTATEKSKKNVLSKKFLGDWTAMSKNHVSISGDMKVEGNKLTFSKKGELEFEILKYNGKEYILKISKNVDSGSFMRLGPISSSENSQEIQVAYYESEDKALAERKSDQENAMSWGVYFRGKSSASEENPAKGNYCFRNEYPHKDTKDKDVIELSIDVHNGSARGIYNWLPAFKDERKGKFRGRIENNVISGEYNFTQEGKAQTVQIEITLNETEAIVKGFDPSLGLDERIKKVECRN